MFFNGFNEETRKMFMDNIDKHSVLTFIIYQTNYNKNGYEKLCINQCYISSSIISDVTKINLSKVKRILKALENEGYFKYVYKSTGGNKKPSIIQVNFDNWIKLKNEQGNKPVMEPVGEQVTPIENTENIAYLNLDEKPGIKPLAEHLSKNKSRNIYSIIQNEFNCICIDLDNVKFITDKRKKLLDEIFKYYGQNLDIFLRVFKNISKSAYLNGKNKHGWKADFDWIIQIDNFTKIYEGKYKDKNDLSKGNNKKYDKYGYEIL